MLSQKEIGIFIENKPTTEDLIFAFKIGATVKIQEFYMNQFELEISAYVKGKGLKVKTFFIKADQLIFILEKMNFIVDDFHGIFDTFSQTKFNDISEIYEFYNFTEEQKSQILFHYLSYKMYI